jgi:hypothetical protein
LKVHFNIILPSMPGSPKWSPSLGSSHPKSGVHLFSHVCAACPTHHILLNLITRIIFGDEYRSLTSSLCSLLHSPVASSLLGPNIFLQHPILEHPQSVFLLQCERPSFTPVLNNHVVLHIIFL